MIPSIVSPIEMILLFERSSGSWPTKLCVTVPPLLISLERCLLPSYQYLPSHSLVSGLFKPNFMLNYVSFLYAEDIEGSSKHLY